MMRKATFIKKLEGWKGDARLYRLAPRANDPDGGHARYVVVSAVDIRIHFPDDLKHLVEDALSDSPLETFIFAADRDGNVVSWYTMEGSYKGALDHEAALSNAGYVLFTPAETQ